MQLIIKHPTRATRITLKYCGSKYSLPFILPQTLDITVRLQPIFLFYAKHLSFIFASCLFPLTEIKKRK